MKNILVIDDNDDVRLTVATTLTEAGYAVQQARDGREGVRLVVAQRPDLIICDVKMPGLDGYHTLQAIRKFSGTAAIPFILMTGSMGPNDFRRGMTSGADDYLVKPFTPTDLLGAVQMRFARQNEVQTDFFRRAEKLRYQELTHLSELAMTAEPASNVEQPVFCLD